ncbi:hypothetical protein DSM02_1285 [Leeuwenhoekiella polynyae]|uniref:Uncharacterized protein n=1 Tax=Leeuwenhoekiella polynyae TaxID=1550906 RepID=A0A4Q0PEM3_9FLAO|nr:hypothetical protein DSM02_1285 [Leeuwenhoekiella polynyae]
MNDIEKERNSGTDIDSDSSFVSKWNTNNYKFGLVCSISFTLRYVALKEHEVPVEIYLYA